MQQKTVEPLCTFIQTALTGETEHVSLSEVKIFLAFVGLTAQSTAWKDSPR